MTAPVTLITGLPGSGKTLYTIATVNKLRTEEGRPVYYHGIPDLSPKLGWIEMNDPTAWETDTAEDSIIVIDEAQSVFVPLGPTSVRPEFYTNLSKIRHAGRSIFLITQNPTFIDLHPRKLIGQHYHVTSPTGHKYAKIFHKRELMDITQVHTEGYCEVMRWGHDKTVYSYYTSATKHNIRPHIPAIFKKTAVLFACLLALVSYAALKIHGMYYADEAEPIAASMTTLEPEKTVTQTTNGYKGTVLEATLTPDQMSKALMPPMPAIPASAPIYQAQFLQVQQIPKPQCLTIGKQCRCYSQQATRLDIPDSFCRLYVEKGWFDHTKPPTQQHGRDIEESVESVKDQRKHELDAVKSRTTDKEAEQHKTRSGEHEQDVISNRKV